MGEKLESGKDSASQPVASDIPGMSTASHRPDEAHPSEQAGTVSSPATPKSVSAGRRAMRKLRGGLERLLNHAASLRDGTRLKPSGEGADSPVIRSLRHRLTVIIMLLAGSIVFTSIAVSALSSYSRMSALVDQSLRKGLSEESDYLRYDTGAALPSGSAGAATSTDGSGQEGAPQPVPQGMGMGHLPVLWFDLDSDWVPTASNLGVLSFDYDSAIACINAAQEIWEAGEYAWEADPATHDTVKVVSGDLAGTHLTYKAMSTDDGWRIAVVDTTSTDDATFHQLGTDALLLVASSVMLLMAARWLSGRLVAPVSDAWERQRRFVADASHELKTPLAVIMANTQILEADKKIPAGSRRWVTGTAEEAERMKGLVDGLLELARTEDAGASMVREPVDWSNVVEDEVLQFDSVAYERGCGMSDDVEGGISVMGSREQLDRLVRTLLDNATKYADDGTDVTVRLSRNGKRGCDLTVTNMCDPMSPDDVAHVFDRFWRSDASRARTERGEVGGYGLGLAIARGIVEGHGGSIRCESDAEHGTRFIVTLPTA